MKKLKNEFEITGELEFEDINNYNTWSYTLEYEDMTKAYNSQN